MGTPTIVPIDSVTIPLALPNIMLPDKELNIEDLNEVTINIRSKYMLLTNACLGI
jgi:hypothetical protein